MDLDVLIVGAGPTGLALAEELTRFGLRYRIVDSGRGPTDLSKAIAVQARTLELLDIVGLADDLVSRGNPARAFHLYDGSRPILRLDFTELHSRFPFRDVALPLVSSLPWFQQQVSATVGELSIDYRHSPVVLDRGGSTGPHAGERAPDGTVLRGSGEGVRLYELLRDVRFLALASGPTPPPSPPPSPNSSRTFSYDPTAISPPAAGVTEPSSSRLIIMEGPLCGPAPGARETARVRHTIPWEASRSPGRLRRRENAFYQKQCLLYKKRSYPLALPSRNWIAFLLQ